MATNTRSRIPPGSASMALAPFREQSRTRDSRRGTGARSIRLRLRRRVGEARVLDKPLGTLQATLEVILLIFCSSCQVRRPSSRSSARKSVGTSLPSRHITAAKTSKSPGFCPRKGHAVRPDRPVAPGHDKRVTIRIPNDITWLYLRVTDSEWLGRNTPPQMRHGAKQRVQHTFPQVSVDPLGQTTTSSVSRSTRSARPIMNAWTSPAGSRTHSSHPKEGIVGRRPSDRIHGLTTADQAEPAPARPVLETQENL